MPTVTSPAFRCGLWRATTAPVRGPLGRLPHVAAYRRACTSSRRFSRPSDRRKSWPDGRSAGELRMDPAGLAGSHAAATYSLGNWHSTTELLPLTSPTRGWHALRAGDVSGSNRSEEHKSEPQ